MRLQRFNNRNKVLFCNHIINKMWACTKDYVLVLIFPFTLNWCIVVKQWNLPIDLVSSSYYIYNSAVLYGTHFLFAQQFLISCKHKKKIYLNKQEKFKLSYTA